jgi:hypothetical protein
MKVISKGWKGVNIFWIILRRFEEMDIFSPTSKHIISDGDAYKCDECDFISTSCQGAKLHRTSKHKNINSIINRERPVINGHLKPIFHDTQNVFSDFSDISFDNSRASSEMSRLTSDQEDMNHPISDDESRTTESEEKNNVQVIKETKSKCNNREMLTEKWKRKYTQKNDLYLPRITGNHYQRVSEGLKRLFRNDLLSLLKKHSPLDESNKEWEHFEAACLKISSKIQSHIIKNLNVKPKKIALNNRRSNKKNNRTSKVSLYKVRKFGLDQEEKTVCRLAGVLRELHSLSKDENLSQGRANVIAKLESEALALSLKLPQSKISHIFGEANIDAIRRLVRESSVEEREGRLDWAHFELLKEDEEMKRKFSLLTAGSMQSLYHDEPKRAYRHITSDAQPELNIKLSELHEFFGSRWSHKSEIEDEETDNVWSLQQRISEEAKSDWIRMLTDKDRIRNTILTRGNRAAPGIDKITNPFFKLAINESTEFFILLIQILLKFRKLPSIWKVSKVILLFKKDDPNMAENWRPISLTSTIYRIMMAHIANTFFEMNSQYTIISPLQKGFKPNINGCMEHITKVNELINIAKQEKRAIFVCSIDLKDAFGSIPHSLIMKNLETIGVPNELVSLLRDSYKKTTSIISTVEGLSDVIEIKKGVKQGCPLSPILFDISIDGLIQAITKLHFDDGFKHLIKNSVVSETIQAYADDILLFSESLEGLNRMLRSLELFCNYSTIQPSPSKCVVMHYTGKQYVRTPLDNPVKIFNETLSTVDLREYIKYLGAPLAARSHVKTSMSKVTVEKTLRVIKKVSETELRINQKVHLVRTFILPSLDYLLMNGQVRTVDLKKLDTEIRKMFLTLMKGSKLPVEFFYTDWKDGGLGFHSLEERKKVLILSTFGHLCCSESEEVRDFSDDIIGRDISRYKIDQAENQNFLNWSNSENL